jgi:hypothetical protein
LILFNFEKNCREDGFAIFIGTAANAANPKALTEAGVKYHVYNCSS